MSRRKGQLVTYAAITAEQAARLLPPDVLPLCRQLRCHRCRRPCVALARTFDLMAALCRRHGRRLRVACHRCLGTRGAPDGVLLLDDERVGAALQRYAAEQN
jgi:hypothetical protein